ncbi:TPA: hypothetical protein VDT66_002061 [Pseudomonas aeruginosa]|uniref:phage tail terminator-like protein n=1 Tax=Pseudomonas aeruginosa TaxID=287 RepID=UPI002D7BD2C0|nr:hypothetical protein [Pseudomonas aeruginosa]
MSHSLARQAIEEKLNSWAKGRPIRVAFQASSFTPEVGETYLRGYLLPSGTSTPHLAGEALEFRGVYQVSIVCPSGQSLGIAESLVDEITLLFRVDSRLSRGDFEGIVAGPVEQGPAIFDDASYIVPASFAYRGAADQ